MYANFSTIDGSPPNSAVSRCFENIAPILLEFASRHSLFVRKYYRNEPMWSFHFLHPKGGFGVVQLHVMPIHGEAFNAYVTPIWWFDDEERCRRSSLPINLMSLASKSVDDVVQFLEQALIYILAKSPVDLTQTSTTTPRGRDDSGNIIFSEFERAQRLPT
jgi:hypothetical protein